MSKSDYWIRSGAYVFLQRLAIFFFGFGSYFFLVRYFPKDAFGVWALFVVITSVVEMSRSAFIQNAFVKFYTHPGINHSSLVAASLFLNFASNTLFIVVMVVLIPFLKSFWHTTEIGPLILWYCLTSIILIPFTQLNYVEQACHSFKGIFWSAVVRQGLFFGTVVLSFFFIPDLSLVFFAALQSVCALAGLMTAWYFSGKLFPRKLLMDWALVRTLFSFGKFILGTGVTSSIGKNTDHVLLGSLSHSSVALYNAAIRIMNFVEIPTYSISNVVYPKIAERVNTSGKEAARWLYEKSVAYIIAIILPIILVIALFPGFILLLTASKNYVEASSVLRLIVLGAVLFPFNVQVGTAFEVIGKPHVSFGINFTSSMVNLVMNLLLIYKFGIMGAAWAVVITNASVFIVSQWLLRRELKVSILRVILQIPGAYVLGFQEMRGFVKRKFSHAA